LAAAWYFHFVKNAPVLFALPLSLLGLTTPAEATPVLPPAPCEEVALTIPPGTLSMDVDVALQRRAVDFLEEGRDRSGSVWTDARLDGEAIPLFRPGQTEPSYVEFAVHGPEGEPRGFMVLSTGEHDAPVVHASMSGPSPSAQLRTLAASQPAKILRLGQTYVAVDEDGSRLAQLGKLPQKMVGFEPAWLDLPDETRAGWARYADGEYREHRPGVGEAIRFEAWTSWAALRDGFMDNRAPLHERDRRAAADDWEFERQLRQNGETLQQGQFRELPLLPRGSVRYRVSGGGSDYVEVELAERTIEGDTALRAFVDGVPDEGVYPVDIDVTYGDGSEETLRLNVTRQLPSNLLGFAAAPTATAGTVRERIAPLPLPSLECSKVAFKTHHGMYLERDGDVIEGTGRHWSEAELFDVDHLGGGRITLRAENGKWVQALGRGGGNVRANAIGPTREATFYIFDRGAKAPGFYGLQTSDRNHFLYANGDGLIKADAARSTWSQFAPAMCEPLRIQSHWAGSSFADAWSKVRKYDQLPAKKAPSRSQCASGCGATAWAMLFGFHDYEASLGSAKWRDYTGIYRRDGSKDGPDEVAPEWFWPSRAGILYGIARTDPDVHPHRGMANVVWELAQTMNDFVLAGCSPDGQKWTAPVIMGRAHKYLQGRADGLRLISDYDGAMIFTHEGKTKAKRVITGLSQPVVIGIRDPEHYPLAFGWEKTRYKVWKRGAKKWSNAKNRSHFVVHLGHQEPFSSLVPYDSWFQGSLRVPGAGVGKANGEPAKAQPKATAVTGENKTIPAPQPAPKPIVKPQPKLPGTKLPTVGPLK
jgi:hypothetical protein